MKAFIRHYSDAFSIGFITSVLNIEYLQQILLTLISITISTFAKYAVEVQIAKWKQKNK